MEAQGLIVPAPDQGHGTAYRVLNRRARRFQSEAEFASYAVARMLPREALNPKLAEKVWTAFMRGEFDVAVFQAMKAVEVAVRYGSGLPVSLLGVKLMREAFRDNGVLADMTAEAGERVGRMELFAGAIGSYKNPHSHRDVNLNDPAEAATGITDYIKSDGSLSEARKMANHADTRTTQLYDRCSDAASLDDYQKVGI